MDFQTITNIQKLAKTKFKLFKRKICELRVIDTDRIQSLGTLQTNALVDRFTKIYTTSGAGIYNVNNVYNYQTLRVQLYTDYESMDTDAIVASALDIIADECTLKNEHGEMLYRVKPNPDARMLYYCPLGDR